MISYNVSIEICRWKKSENWLTFDWVIWKRLWVFFAMWTQNRSGCLMPSWIAQLQQPCWKGRPPGNCCWGSKVFNQVQQPFTASWSVFSSERWSLSHGYRVLMTLSNCVTKSRTDVRFRLQSDVCYFRPGRRCLRPGVSENVKAAAVAQRCVKVCSDHSSYLTSFDLIATELSSSERSVLWLRTESLHSARLASPSILIFAICPPPPKINTYQRPFSDRKTNGRLIIPATGVPILKIWWRSVQYILR